MNQQRMHTHKTTKTNMKKIASLFSREECLDANTHQTVLYMNRNVLVHPIGIRGVNYIALAIVPSWALPIAMSLLASVGSTRLVVRLVGDYKGMALQMLARERIAQRKAVDDGNSTSIIGN